MKNKNGFTLIELLAVIVILGLLMAIAIPSVTKYIQQSRTKTLLDTMESYTDAVVNGVNDMEYGTLSDGNKLYYIPIDCISLEKGGTDPFGEWEEAYVVVHYNADEYTYEYYFTYYDAAGYGMGLTSIDEISKGDIANPTDMNAKTITKQTLDGEDIVILDEGSCNSSISKVVSVDKNGNDKIDVGDLIRIGTESFYVISNDGTNVKAIAQYNLLVGKKWDGTSCPGNDMSTELKDATGLQDASQSYKKGVVIFATSSYWGNSNGVTVDLSNSLNSIYPYLSAYKEKLNQMNGNVKNISLITKSELEKLGCDFSKETCASAPSWIYSVDDYWVNAVYDNQHIYTVTDTRKVSYSWYKPSSMLGEGVRPVITLNESDIK